MTMIDSVVWHSDNATHVNIASVGSHSEYWWWFWPLLQKKQRPGLLAYLFCQLKVLAFNLSYPFSQLQSWWLIWIEPLSLAQSIEKVMSSYIVNIGLYRSVYFIINGGSFICLTGKNSVVKAVGRCTCHYGQEYRVIIRLLIGVVSKKTTNSWAVSHPRWRYAGWLNHYSFPAAVFCLNVALLNMSASLWQFVCVYMSHYITEQTD